MAYGEMEKNHYPIATQLYYGGDIQKTGSAETFRFTLPKGKWLIFWSIGWSSINTWFFLRKVNATYNICGMAPAGGGGSATTVIVEVSTDTILYVFAPSLTTQSYAVSNVYVNAIKIGD